MRLNRLLFDDSPAAREVAEAMVDRKAPQEVSTSPVQFQA